MSCSPEKNCCEKEKVPLSAFRALVKKVNGLGPQLVPEGGTDGQILTSTGSGFGWETLVVTWSGITGKPSTFPPSTHTHSITQVIGLTTALNGKADVVHGHSMSDISGLTAALNGKAALVHSHTISQVAGLQAELDNLKWGPISTKTADYTATIDDEVILVDSTAGNRIVTLPPVASSVGLELVVKKISIDVNQVTIDANASELIDGATTQVLVIQWQMLRIKNDGIAWYIVGEYTP